MRRTGDHGVDAGDVGSHQVSGGQIIEFAPVRAPSRRAEVPSIDGKRDDNAIATVGHELRHALEVLETSKAITEAEVDALFDRIGWQTSAHTVETQAALDAGNAIARELLASKKTQVDVR